LCLCLWVRLRCIDAVRMMMLRGRRDFMAAAAALVLR
jgi:hypothetical protein